MRASQVIDVSLTPGDKTSGFLTPVVGIEGGIQIDYDRKKQVLFWVEGKEDDDENVSDILNTFIVRPDSQFDIQSTVHHDIFLY
jgi:hypothetical protein